MELKDCAVTRLQQALDAKKIPHSERVDTLVEMLDGHTGFDCSPNAIYPMQIINWLAGVRPIEDKALIILAPKLGVETKWLVEGKGTRYKERLGLGSNEVDWTVEQRKLYNFDRGEMRDKALAWVLMHQHPELVAEFCSPENGHDVRGMRVDIRVNDVELPVKKFEDIISNLSDAMLAWKMRESGLDSVEKSSFVQAESVLRKLHGDTYDKLGDVMSQLDNMRDNIETLNQLAWSAFAMEKLHGLGAFPITLPPAPEHWFDAEKHGKSSRQHAIELLVLMVNGARSHLFRDGLKVSDLPKEHERLDAVARSIYHDLSEDEQAYCDANFAMSDFNKDLQ